MPIRGPSPATPLLTCLPRASATRTYSLQVAEESPELLSVEPRKLSSGEPRGKPQRIRGYGLVRSAGAGRGSRSGGAEAGDQVSADPGPPHLQS